MSWEKSFWAVACLLVAGFGQLAAKPLLIVTSFPLNADWTRQITESSSCEMIVLASNQQDVHTFEPGPRQAVSLAKADLVIEIGGGFEPWMDDLLVATDFQGKRLILTKATHFKPDPIAQIDNHDHGHDDHGHDHIHVHEHADAKHHDQDPHFWTSPEHVIEVAHVITETLCELDPENAARYEKNFARYEAELNALDAYADETFAAIPPERKVIITHHGNLYHFGARYNIEIPATLLGSFTTEGSEPSARQIVNILEIINDEGVTAVFTESTVSPRLAQQVCHEAGLPPPPVLYIEAFSCTDEGPQDYTSQFRYTVDTIAKAIQTEP